MSVLTLASIEAYKAEYIGSSTERDDIMKILRQRNGATPGHSRSGDGAVLSDARILLFRSDCSVKGKCSRNGVASGSFELKGSEGSSYPEIVLHWR